MVLLSRHISGGPLNLSAVLERRFGFHASISSMTMIFRTSGFGDAVAAAEGNDGPRYIIPLILAEAASPRSDFVRICSLIEATNELDSKLEPRTCSKS